MIPRGLRNNNPGNLNYAGQPGAHLETGVPAPRFAAFPTMDEGVHALCKQLCLYFTRHYNTVADIIFRWAPPTENITKAYVGYVAHQMAVLPSTTLAATPSNIAHLAMAITSLENGRNPLVFSEVFKQAQLAIQEVMHNGS